MLAERDIADDWREGGFAVYVHWPFCLAKCPYCDFNSHVRAGVDAARWQRALVESVESAARLVPGRTVSSIFFGGGTPSLMSPDTVAAVIEAVRTGWRLAPDAEITLEANPTSVEAGRFRGEHGRRSSLYVTVSAPSWIEDPTPLITVLQDAVTQPERDPLARLAELAEERERLTAEARARLEEFPAAVREQFEFLLDAARQGSVLQEDHNYWIDTQIVYAVRRVVLELGRRLVANGAVDAEDDVFHLRLEELDDPRRRSAGGRRRAPARARPVPRGQLAADPRNAAPGAATGRPDLARGDQDVRRAAARVGARRRALRHGGLSRCRTRARPHRPLARRGRVARVRRDPRRAHDRPALDPLFARAAAIVTDAGGILSHCAVVAREYSIPAVVGSKRATAVLRDGQLVEVDGTNGRIHLVDE